MRLLSESSPGFSLSRVPLFVFQLLVSGLLGHTFQKIFNWKFEEAAVKFGVLYATGIAFIVSLAKNHLPFAVIAASTILLFGFTLAPKDVSYVGYVLIVVIAVGCGLSCVLQSLVVAVIFAGALLFLPKNEDQKTKDR